MVRQFASKQLRKYPKLYSAFLRARARGTDELAVKALARQAEIEAGVSLIDMNRSGGDLRPLLDYTLHLQMVNRVRGSASGS